ncbi:uncharacterized protein BDR25DRAFT_22663 [Lindgomyces ingoldianus]|uniref:Uncharacterized protein n=1 Tax=Lindgomyces ingoldianus TaxID=673940 RepID=A0ACB6QZQ3_9PLEO|nr:uncharacterized protein BDR25DRAFT_22663 [Lindgomyces ingoldianus]KAF2471747.1 hypothetical protein BDR25DRAFT_22663 [Lindgomyces ingoldianus]
MRKRKEFRCGSWVRSISKRTRYTLTRQDCDHVPKVFTALKAFAVCSKISEQPDSQQIQGTLEGIFSRGHLTNLNMFFSRSWFGRRGVPQEAAMAHHATIHCGDSKLDWRWFSRGAQVLLWQLNKGSKYPKGHAVDWRRYPPFSSRAKLYYCTTFGVSIPQNARCQNTGPPPSLGWLRTHLALSPSTIHFTGPKSSLELRLSPSRNALFRCSDI